MKFFFAVILCVAPISCSALPTDPPESKKMVNELVDAIIAGNVDRVQELANEKIINMAYEGGSGRRPLHMAAENGNMKIVEVLIKKGADINAIDEDLTTPLHLAASNDNEVVTDFLIKHGANIDKAGVGGITPLFLAALNRNEKIMETLLNNNANVSILNDAGDSALYWAVLVENEKNIDQLVKKGAVYDSDWNDSESLIRSGANVNTMNIRSGNQKCKEELLKFRQMKNIPLDECIMKPKRSTSNIRFNEMQAKSSLPATNA